VRSAVAPRCAAGPHSSVKTLAPLISRAKGQSRRLSSKAPDQVTSSPLSLLPVWNSDDPSLLQDRCWQRRFGRTVPCAGFLAAPVRSHHAGSANRCSPGTRAEGGPLKLLQLVSCRRFRVIGAPAMCISVRKERIYQLFGTLSRNTVPKYMDAPP
jgi:hypothetical protein